MPKCIKFISGFLLPNLNSGKFGEYLKWVDKSKKMFQIIWHHKNCQEWTAQEAEVFVEWDKHKGHFQPNDKAYYTKSKQRFRSLLYKLSIDGHLEESKSADKNKKVYCIVKKKKYKRKFCNDSKAENEPYNEDISSFSDFDDGVSLGNIYRRKISRDDVINILEDHPYSAKNVLQDKEADHEHKQAQDTHYTNVSLHESSEFLEKRVLVEKNNMQDEQSNIQVLNSVDHMQVQDYLMNGDINTEHENQTESLESYKKPSEEIAATFETDLIFYNWENINNCENIFYNWEYL